ncbi:MAG: hypothetical protein Q7U96_00215 [Chloroflexota bacterium]|nr:hypothetical protein [Chloroflexota bacterium]
MMPPNNSLQPTPPSAARLAAADARAVGLPAREKEMKDDDHETASSVRPYILVNILFFSFPSFTTHHADGDFTVSNFGR